MRIAQRCLKTSQNISGCLKMSQISRDVSKYLKMSPNILGCLKICLKISRNVSKFHKISQNISRCFKMSQNILECLKMFKNISGSLKMSLHVFWMSELLPDIGESRQICSCFSSICQNCRIGAIFKQKIYNFEVSSRSCPVKR